MKKNTHGGKREGSGAKPLPPGEKKLQYATKLPQDVIAYLRSRENAAVTIERTLRRTKDFKEWAKR